MRLWKIVVDEAKKFVDMIPVRLTKVGGWLLEWPYSVIAGGGSHRSVFFVAVPRSGSTLLYDLAAWNEGPPRQVVGYGENGASYRSDRDIRRLRIRTMLYLRRRKLPTYVADKLVQSKYRIADAVLTDANCYFVFIDRARVDVVASLGRKLSLGEAEAEALYQQRSAELFSMKSLAVNQLSVSYEHLMADPETELGRISDFLELEQGLTTRYEIPPNVDNFSYGDNGQLIRSGYIVTPSD